MVGKQKSKAPNEHDQGLSTSYRYEKNYFFISEIAAIDLLDQ